ncbi:MAG: UDP-N-acetylglucosamine 2-epimerase, partial [Clostridiales bacterium]
IPKPDYNLGISGGSHGEMTGAMLVAVEKVLLAEKPDALLVYGDTNSTLASALVAAKLHIPVCHIEAGNRLGTLLNPEEINRICTDHVSSMLLACTESAMAFLDQEGLAKRAQLVGDPMYDAFIHYGEQLTAAACNGLLALEGQPIATPKSFYYLTCHREENTATDGNLTEILQAMNSLDAPTIYPVHPRNNVRATKICQKCGLRLRFTPYGELVGEDGAAFPYPTVQAWMQWQKAQLQLAAKDWPNHPKQPLATDHGQTLYCYDGGKKRSLGIGQTILYGDKLVFLPQTRQKQVFYYAQIDRIHLRKADLLNFSLLDGRCFELRSDHPRSALKYLEIYEASR